MSNHDNQFMLRYQNGLGNSAAYQVSGFPQVDVGSGPEIINYDNVTSQVTIANNDGDALTVSASFDGGTAFVLPAGRTVTLNIKCRQVEMAGAAWSVCAALTTINKDALPEP